MNKLDPLYLYRGIRKEILLNSTEVMKFQTNFEGYRNDLSKNLKEKRSESKKDAQDFLATEKETDKYQLSRDIKIVSNKIKQQEGLEKSELDSMGIHIEEIDINDSIPEDMKIWLDRVRLHGYNKKKFKHPDSKKTGLFNISDDFTNFDKNLERIRELTNDLTEGDFFNIERFNTLINAWGGDRRSIDKHKQFELSDKIISPVWFAVNGNDFYDDLRKTIVICNPLGRRFRSNTISLAKFTLNTETMHHRPTQLFNLNELSQTESTSEIDSLYEKAAREALDFANEHKEEGVRVEIKDVKWQDVADWVINISEGKVYKITDENTANKGYLE